MTPRRYDFKLRGRLEHWPLRWPSGEIIARTVRAVDVGHGHGFIIEKTRAPIRRSRVRRAK